MTVAEVGKNTKPVTKLPDGWRWVRLGDVARVFAGSAAPQGKEYFDTNGPPFVRVSDLGKYQRTTCLVDAQDKLSTKAVDECSLVLAKKGSILFPKSGAAVGTNNRAILGKDAYIVSHLMVIEPGGETTSLWLYWVLLQLDMTEFSDNIAYPSLKQSTVQDITIPLPPLSEQKRITSILEEQMAAVEKALAAAEARLEAAKALPAAYVRAAFNGEEVRRWPRQRLGDVCEITAKQVDPKIPEFVSLPHVNGENIETGTCRITYIKTAGELGMISGKYLFEPGDVLYSKLRPYLRKVTVVDFRGVCSADMYPITVNKERLDPHFLARVLVSDEFTNYADSESRRARMPKLNRDQLLSWNIPLPPISIQREIVNKLSGELPRIENLVTIIKEELETINTLPAAFLRRAFSGGL